MCLHTQSQDPCIHPECLMQTPISPSCGMIAPKDQVLQSILMSLLSRNAILSDLFVSSKKILDQISVLEAKKKVLVPDQQIQTHPFITENAYLYKVKILGETPNSVLKEKGFEVHLEVLDNNGEKVFVESLFRVKLFTNESPPKPLKLNIASKKILRGTLESCMNSNKVIDFPNIVINEVSSHYINESFTIVISSENPEIQPFVIENLYVRARNSNKK